MSENQPPFLSVGKKSCNLNILVQPGAKRTEVVGVQGEALKIRVHSPPVDGKANKALLEFLAKEIGCPKRCLALVRGETSRSKSVEVAKEARSQLNAWIKTL